MGLLEDIEAARRLMPPKITQAEDWYIPEGQMFRIQVAKDHVMLALHPADAMRVRFGGKLPFESKFNLGVLEAERDRRKYGKKRHTKEA